MSKEKDVLGGDQHRVAAHDLEECFIARLLLGQVAGDWSEDEVEVDFGIHNLFSQLRSFSDAVNKFGTQTVRVVDRTTRIVAEALSAMFGRELAPREDSVAAHDYYDQLLERRLGYLLKGDSLILVPGMIANYQRTERGLFRVRFSPRLLATALATSLPKRFEVRETFLMKAQAIAPHTSLRIDHRKALDMLQEYIAGRVEVTGEHVLAFDSNSVPFRHVLLEVGAPGTFMPSPGTASPVDKILLPLLLEIHGRLDIEKVFLSSDPLANEDVLVHYVIRRPAMRNGYRATAHGLSAEQRSSLNENQLGVYVRTHEQLNRRYVLGGHPDLEKSFGALMSWALRKQTYCLEEPSFLRDPAIAWLDAHASDKYIQAENKFFLPFIFERLVDTFGDRALKKPEKFGGEIDILFDTRIPIELKVRRGDDEPLGTIVDAKYPPTGQAAAYAAITRLGFVFVLDLPKKSPRLMNLDTCVHVIERDVEASGAFPTCVVVCVFHAHDPKPSGVK